MDKLDLYNVRIPASTDSYSAVSHQNIIEAVYEQLDKRNLQVVKEKLIEGYVKKVDLTPRKLLTLIGTNCGRKMIHPNIWINATFNSYTEDQNWIITDVRFPNEVKKIEELGGVVINITRDDSLKFPNEYFQFENMNSLLAQKHTFLSYLKEHSTDLFRSVTHESETSLDEYDFENRIENNFSLDYLEKELMKVVHF